MMIFAYITLTALFIAAAYQVGYNWGYSKGQQDCLDNLSKRL